MALVQLGRNCRGSFEGYWTVVLDRQGDLLEQVRGLAWVSRDICQSAAQLGEEWHSGRVLVQVFPKPKVERYMVMDGTNILRIS